MEDLFDRYQGRKVNTWGDAIIGEFTSVVEAVRCGVEIQDAITAENQDLPKNEQMWMRIGINLGDVMEDGGDIYGDGVNTAARLESLAEPGGIMVSESVYNFTHKQLAVGYDFAGEQRVKESDEPIVGYRVRMGGSNLPPKDHSAVKNKASSRSGDHHATESGENSQKEQNGTNGKIEQMLDWLRDKNTRFQNWFPNQPRKVKISVFMVGFFFAINFLFSGIATPWFIFPAAPFLLYILLSSRKRD